jgi:hypothetical protein
VRSVACAAVEDARARCSYEYSTGFEWTAATAEFEHGMLLDGKPGWRLVKPQVN